MNEYLDDDINTVIEKAVARSAPLSPIDAEARRRRVEENREAAELARKALAGGMDVEQLDGLASELAKVRRARIDDDRLRAIAESPRIRQQLAELTPALPVPPDSTNEIVDRVTFIRSFAGAGVVIDSNVGSLDSWARYRLNASAGAYGTSGVGRLSFFTLWRNPRSETIVAGVGARLVTHAHLTVDADWNGVAAWFIGGSEARATVRARTTVMAMWDSSVRAVVSDVVLGSAGASGEFFGDDDSASITVNEFLPGSGFTIPAHAAVLIEVALLTEYAVTSGTVDFDAASSDFQISVPHLIITVT